jgi:hypothetical protein
VISVSSAPSTPYRLAVETLLLSGPVGFEESKAEALDDVALLEQLGVSVAGEDDIGVLKHVRSVEERRTAEEIASRTTCKDFEHFKPLFQQVESDLKPGFARRGHLVEMQVSRRGTFSFLAARWCTWQRSATPSRRRTAKVMHE